MLKQLALAMAIITSSTSNIVCYGNTNNQEVIDQKFDSLIADTRTKLDRYLPMQTSDYKMTGESDLNALLTRLSNVNTLGDICQQGLGSVSLCNQNQIYVQPKNLNIENLLANKNLGFALNMNKTPAGFGKYVSKEVKAGNVIMASNKAVLEIDKVTNYINHSSGEDMFQIDKMVQNGMSQLLTEVLKSNELKEYFSINPDYVNDTSQLMGEVAGAFIRKTIDKFSHCQLPSSTQQHILSLAKQEQSIGSAEINQYWITNTETKKYSRCIERTINKKGIKDEMKASMILLDMLKQAEKQGIIEENPINILTNELDTEGEKKVFHSFLHSLDKFNIQSYRHYIKAKNSKFDTLSLKIDMPIYINGKKCNENCYELSKQLESTKQSIQSCKLGSYKLEPEHCQPDGMVINLTDGLADIVYGTQDIGVDYMIYLAQRFSTFQEIGNPELDQVMIGFKTLQRKFNNTNAKYDHVDMTLRFKKVHKPSFFGGKNVWVVNGIELQEK